MASPTLQTATISLWGRDIAAVSWDSERKTAVFEYMPEFLQAPVEPSPLLMPKAGRKYQFPALGKDTFKGLPGLLADSLPDKFGNILIDAWLARQGRSAASFSPVERLCYIGSRGMGALEFSPGLRPAQRTSSPVEIAEMVTLANQVLSDRNNFEVNIDNNDSNKNDALKHILAIGTSAGGARAKAIIAWNPITNVVRSGQVKAPDGFQYWLLKFDGISENRDKELLADPHGFGRIEYAYHQMAQQAGIHMTQCHLMEENGRAHFMTKRFDRTDDGGKLHMQTLCGIAHYDFNMAGAYGYEQAFQVIRQLSMDNERQALEQLYRRMVFNAIARNQDDHTKNIAFLMDKQGRWTLSPAYDITYSYNPEGKWTNRHQMSINGRTEHITQDDLLAVAKHADIKTVKAKQIIEEVKDAVAKWPAYGKAAGVADGDIERIERTLLL